MDVYLKFDDEKLKKTINKNIFEWLFLLSKKLKIDPDKAKVVDLGSGHGQNTLALSYHFGTIYGIDPSAKMLKFSRKLKKRASKFHDFSNVRFYSGNFEDIPIKNVDIVCLFNSIHFSNKVEKDLTYILSHINQGGIIVIVEPHNKCIFGYRVMKNKQNLKKKLNRLKKTRNEIKTFLKWSVKHKKASIIVENETQLKYKVIIQKL